MRRGHVVIRHPAGAPPPLSKHRRIVLSPSLILGTDVKPLQDTAHTEGNAPKNYIKHEQNAKNMNLHKNHFKHKDEKGPRGLIGVSSPLPRSIGHPSSRRVGGVSSRIPFEKTQRNRDFRRRLITPSRGGLITRAGGRLIGGSSEPSSPWLSSEI